MRFEEYAAQRLEPLFRFAVVLSGDRGVAEDVVQEILIRLHALWPQLARVDNLDAYVRRMVVNEYLSWRRKWARVVPTEADRLPQMAVPDFTDEHAERDRLIAELAGLPVHQRAAIVLRFYEGLSYEEAGKVLGCKPGTVRGQVSRALSALRISLDESTAQVPADLASTLTCLEDS